MNRSTFWANLRTIGLVTLVTLLIWIWADAETQGGRGTSDLIQAGGGSGGWGAAGGGRGGAETEEVQHTVESLPVLVAMAFSRNAGGGGVSPETTELKRITIAGPRAVIDRIKAGDPTLKLSAVLVLDSADWDVVGPKGEMGQVSKGVEIVPGGLGLRFVGPPPTVRATVSR